MTIEDAWIGTCEDCKRENVLVRRVKIADKTLTLCYCCMTPVLRFREAKQD